MELTIRTAEGSGADLYRWLATDPPVRAFAAAAAPPPPAPAPGSGTMGTGFDLLNLIVPNAIGLGGLLVSLVSFIDQRRRGTGTAPQISVAAGGVVVVVNGDVDPAVLTAQIQAAVAAQSGQAAAAAQPGQAPAVSPGAPSGPPPSGASAQPAPPPVPPLPPAPPAVPPPAAPGGPTGAMRLTPGPRGPC